MIHTALLEHRAMSVHISVVLSDSVEVTEWSCSHAGVQYSTGENVRVNCNIWSVRALDSTMISC